MWGRWPGPPPARLRDEARTGGSRSRPRLERHCCSQHGDFAEWPIALAGHVVLSRPGPTHRGEQHCGHRRGRPHASSLLHRPKTGPRVPAHAAHGAEGVDLLAGGQPFEERRRLELHAHPRQHRRVARPHPLAAHRELTGVGTAQPVDCLQEPALPAPSGPRTPTTSLSPTSS